MRTPAGKECKYFFGDYFRGRHREECRLLTPNRSSGNWTSDLCFRCPIPGINQANACENMELIASIHRPFPFIQRVVKVDAYCSKSQCSVDEPHIGCGECHTLPPAFIGEPRDSDSTG